MANKYCHNKLVKRIQPFKIKIITSIVTAHCFLQIYTSITFDRHTMGIWRLATLLERVNNKIFTTAISKNVIVLHPPFNILVQND